MESLHQALEWAKQHPWISGALALYLLLCALGNKQISQETAERWPRFAALWIVAQKVALVGRGLLKPLLGIVLPSAAREVVEQIFPGAFTTSTKSPPGGS